MSSSVPCWLVAISVTSSSEPVMALAHRHRHAGPDRCWRWTQPSHRPHLSPAGPADLGALGFRHDALRIRGGQPDVEPAIRAADVLTLPIITLLPPSNRDGG